MEVMDILILVVLNVILSLRMAAIGLGGWAAVPTNDVDSRIPCRYGQKCYQKNPLHHQKYKHPPKRKLEVSYSYQSKIYAEVGCGVLTKVAVFRVVSLCSLVQV